MRVRFFLYAVFLLINVTGLHAQILKRKVQEVKDKSNQRVENRSTEGVDAGLDKVEEGIGNLFKKKNHKNDTDTLQPDTGNRKGFDPAVTVTDSEGNTDFSAYKNFDFVPGQKLLFFDDFADASKSRWDAYEPELLQVVKLDNSNWLKIKGTAFFPSGLATLPGDYTLEFDARITDAPCGSLDIRLIDHSQAERLGDPFMDNAGVVTLSPVSQIPKTGLGSYQKKINGEDMSRSSEFKFYTWQPGTATYTARISMSVNQGKASLWINKEKVMEQAEITLPGQQYMLAFLLQNYFVAETEMYITNVRLATGVINPKTEIAVNKLFVTQNIYFDVNSDVIRPGSYPALKQIAESLSGSKDSILITGHTDSDGNDADNLLLSEKRAAAVKKALVNEFGIDATLLFTEGKGETQPLNKNLTPADKARNRRVEFRKL